jgi:hypothetical protein
MLDTLKVILIFLFGVLISFGSWYLIFWFLTGESDMFTWYWGVKLIYLIFGYSSLRSVLEFLLEEI